MKKMIFCKGHGCSAIDQCARYRELPEFIYQDFFDKTPGVDETCDYFLKPQEDAI